MCFALTVVSAQSIQSACIPGAAEGTPGTHQESMLAPHQGEHKRGANMIRWKMKHSKQVPTLNDFLKEGFLPEHHWATTCHCQELPCTNTKGTHNCTHFYSLPTLSLSGVTQSSTMMLVLMVRHWYVHPTIWLAKLPAINQLWPLENQSFVQPITNSKINHSINQWSEVKNYCLISIKYNCQNHGQPPNQKPASWSTINEIQSSLKICIMTSHQLSTISRRSA